MKIRYKSGYRHVLQNAVTFLVPVKESDINNDILARYDIAFIELSTHETTIKKHYAWDGASGYPDFKSIIRASLIHDALYQLIRNQVIKKHKRKDFDKVFLNTMKEDGVIWPVRMSAYFAVRLFGGKYIKRGSKRPVKTAP